MLLENNTTYHEEIFNNWKLRNNNIDILNTYNKSHSFSISTDRVFQKLDSISGITHIFKDNKHESRYVLDINYCIIHNWFEDTIKIYAFHGNIFYCAMAKDFLNTDFSEIIIDRLRGF